MRSELPDLDPPQRWLPATRLAKLGCLQLARGAIAEIAGSTASQIANPREVPPRGDSLHCPLDAARRERGGRSASDVTGILTLAA